MKAGELRHRVAFETAVDTQEDTTGEPIRSWTALCTVWAKVEPLTGREADVSGGVESERDTKITCRYSSVMSGVREKDRALFGGVYYNIVSIRHIAMNQRELQFMCKSGLNAG